MKTLLENPNGLHQKYRIQKIVPVEKIANKGLYGKRSHDRIETKLVDVDKNAEYFVLRLDLGGSDINHIKASRIGIHAYADAVEASIPQLAADLRERYPLILKMDKIAITSNSEELSVKVIEKLEKDGIIPKGKMKPFHLYNCCYILDKDIMVSHLCLEMHYPEYNLVYASEFLTGKGVSDAK